MEWPVSSDDNSPMKLICDICKKPKSKITFLVLAFEYGILIIFFEAIVLSCSCEGCDLCLPHTQSRKGKQLVKEHEEKCTAENKHWVCRFSIRGSICGYRIACTDFSPL